MVACPLVLLLFRLMTECVGPSNGARSRCSLRGSLGYISYDSAHFQAPEKSKQLPLEELQPPAPRPKTSSAVARRLIGMALGEPGLRDKVI